MTISREKVTGTVEAQGLLVYSTRKAKLDADKRTTLLDRYLARLDTIKRHLNTRKYKKAAYTWEQLHKAQSNYAAVKELVEVQLQGEDGQLVLRFDVRADRMTLAQEQDGRYLLVTNRPLSAEEMMKHFKAQDQLEKRNQTLKGPIRIRPLFLHKQERIESLIFICMLALLAFFYPGDVGQACPHRYDRRGDPEPLPNLDRRIHALQRRKWLEPTRPIECFPKQVHSSIGVASSRNLLEPHQPSIETPKVLKTGLDLFFFLHKWCL